MVFRGSLAEVNSALQGSTFRPKVGIVGLGRTLTSDDLSWAVTARDTDKIPITVR